MATAVALPASLRRLKNIVEHDGISTPAEAGSALEAAEVAVEDLRPWANFDHPAGDSYGRKLVAQGENFELMVMSWLPGDLLIALPGPDPLLRIVTLP